MTHPMHDLGFAVICCTPQRHRQLGRTPGFLEADLSPTLPAPTAISSRGHYDRLCACGFWYGEVWGDDFCWVSYKFFDRDTSSELDTGLSRKICRQASCEMVG